ncbi:MAG: hypothetical protein WKF96_10385 [Solirubrobacteraceae bacterium]
MTSSASPDGDGVASDEPSARGWHLGAGILSASTVLWLIVCSSDLLVVGERTDGRFVKVSRRAA